MMNESDFQGNVERFSGFAAHYDRHRPGPPAVLAAILAKWARVKRPSLVVDLGSGAGLATRYWAERAERVVGVV